MVKNMPANAGDSKDIGPIPGWGISSGVGNGNLKNAMDRGSWQATVMGNYPQNWTDTHRAQGINITTNNKIIWVSLVVQL